VDAPRPPARRPALAFVLVAGCASKPAATSPEVEGSLSVDGKPLVITQCRAGRTLSTYVELVTGAGKLRFEDKQLYWSADTDEVVRGERLACNRLDRSWGGGLRADGTSYFRGHLIFACTGKVGAIAGDVTVDCGKITAEERAQLDRNRADLLRDAAPAPDAGPQ
jgi:hypothetical protein